MATLPHSNIVRVENAFVDRGNPNILYMLMELANGDAPGGYLLRVSGLWDGDGNLLFNSVFGRDTIGARSYSCNASPYIRLFFTRFLIVFSVCAAVQAKCGSVKSSFK
eukprot:GHVT01020328.1.p1 GENE.GHVT01020328.1~~GHVT01020328.1.p1  ORF type:complete len:108 (+),score=4.42 GHVT01020328.1:636-959(+)